MINELIHSYQQKQEKICQQLQEHEPVINGIAHPWKKPIGYGKTMLFSNGQVIEKGAVNFSHVKGKVSLKMAEQLGVKASYFEATGISSIIHPVNPWVPIIHLNVRYFTLDNGFSWFGGGVDLTPHYVDLPQAIWFHQQLKYFCDTYNPLYYPTFKQHADDYFYLPHRKESRGIGGIFFDHLSENLEGLKTFSEELLDLYPKLYGQLIHWNQQKPYGERETQWQQLRRGRYIEFNLVYDRGTKFGLTSKGNIEGILMSLPNNPIWTPYSRPKKNSEEAKTLSYLKKKIDWVH